jgi:D-beta-D-heptose 7-phosphate kinase/D-beta-D-heptose 1-phosphate adenosyltransferase
MNRTLAQHVEAISGRKALLVGDLILDRYVYGDAERISPEAPVPVLRAVETREAVGGSANVAACLKALGCEVFCCGVVGSDRHGQTLMRLLAALGVEVSGVVVSASRPTTTKTRLVGLAQHRHRQQLLRLDEEETSALSAEDRKQMVDAALRFLPHVDVVCIEDYDKSVVSEALARAVIDGAHSADRTVLVDPARITDYTRYRGADILTPNRDELSLAAGRSLPTLTHLAEAAGEMLGRYDIEAMVVTVDREGALLVQAGSPWMHLKTSPRSVYDNTGAGDAVLAMLAGALAGGAGLEHATRLANIAGGLEVERFGCVPITTDEVLAELRLIDRRSGGKLRRLAELVPELALRRDRGETVAFTNGCFDVLHAGHVDFLRRARQEGSVLVVGLNSDASVRAQGKGADRPINTFDDRVAVLTALESVDYIVGFDDPEPRQLIQEVRPDVLVKGEDWAEKGVVGREFVEASAGRVVLLPLVAGISTTELIRRIRCGGT